MGKKNLRRLRIAFSNCPGNGDVDSLYQAKPLLKREVGLAFGFVAVVLCAWGLIIGGWAIQAYRDEVRMSTSPATEATVLAIQKRRFTLYGQISFVGTASGGQKQCKTETSIGTVGDNLHVGSILLVIPRSNSCGEPVIVGQRHTKVLAIFGIVVLLVASLLGLLSFRSVLR